MLMSKEYFDEIKGYIMEMNEEELAKRGTTKEDVLRNQDTMEKLWCVYQKDVEKYGCDREFSLDDAVNEVLGSVSTQKKPHTTYRCLFCGSERFIGHQEIHAEVYVGGNGEFEGNMPGGLETNIYDSGKPYGPFTCANCGQEYDELLENKQVKLPRGTFPVVSSSVVKKFKEAGYGYSHEANGYTVVSDGKKAVAMSDCDYNRYYGGQRSFIL